MTVAKNGNIYRSATIVVRGNRYTVTQVDFPDNTLKSVNIIKITNNPYRTLGKDFKDYNEATLHYKSAEMKVELLKIETGFITLI